MSAEESLSVRQRAKAYYKTAEAVQYRREQDEREKLHKEILEEAIQIFGAEKCEFITLDYPWQEALVLDDDITLYVCKMHNEGYEPPWIRFELVYVCKKCDRRFVPRDATTIHSLEDLGRELEKQGQVNGNKGKIVVCPNCEPKYAPEQLPPNRIADALEQIAGAMQEK